MKVLFGPLKTTIPRARSPTTAAQAEEGPLSEDYVRVDLVAEDDESAFPGEVDEAL